MEKEVSAIIAAAGSSARMGGSIPKQLINLNGKPIIYHTLMAFTKSSLVKEIIIVCRESDYSKIQEISNLLSTDKKIKICFGGSTRQESIQNGLALVSESSDFIAIHDGARPLVKASDIDEYIRCAFINNAVAPAIKITDTVKKIDGNFIVDTVDRDVLRAVQTPQIFKKSLYLKALEASKNEKINFTDDCKLIESIGEKVYIISGDENNIKITYKSDLLKAEAILNERGVNMLRIGQGYDVHRLVENRKLILGGVEIPYEKGLLGHSDADVLIHAIMDAILGAVGLGDIGKWFPDNDEKYLGADSLELLKEVCRIIDKNGFEIVNIDSTIIAQKPKLSNYIDSMKENLAAVTLLPLSALNIKATTEEGLGFSGRGEGIAAQAVCLLQNKLS